MNQDESELLQLPAKRTRIFDLYFDLGLTVSADRNHAGCHPEKEDSDDCRTAMCCTGLETRGAAGDVSAFLLLLYAAQVGQAFLPAPLRTGLEACPYLCRTCYTDWRNALVLPVDNQIR